jgi:hypothetical protein
MSDVKWVRFTKRTCDPKLAWLERRLAGKGIRSRRSGDSWHAPILEVPENQLDAAWEFLSSIFDGENNNQTIDDMDDDDPVFLED